MPLISWDVLIIGAGHNGLVCAAYLAGAGLRVTVLERRHVVGGAGVTEEFYPGFRNSGAAYTVSLLNPKVIRDLDLHAYGLRIHGWRGPLRGCAARPACEPPRCNGAGRHAHAGLGAPRPRAALRCFAAGWGRAEFASRVGPPFGITTTPEPEAGSGGPGSRPFAPILPAGKAARPPRVRKLVLVTPPNVVAGGWRQALPELLRAAKLGGHLRHLDLAAKRELLRWLVRAPARLPARL